MLPRILLITILACFILAHDLLASNSSDTEAVIQKMESAYSAVHDYQAQMEIRTYQTDGSFAKKKFLYTFKKPKKIRLDFESPYPGLIVIYPDKNGKVEVHRFFTLHLSPDDPLLQIDAGQRIDQTDLGLLIKNIGHSLTDRRRGPLDVQARGESIGLRVFADDHFREGVITLYEFFVSKKIWLPERVEESKPNGLLERVVFFRNLKMNLGTSDEFFQLNGG